jgi:hypothetical protein
MLTGAKEKKHLTQAICFHLDYYLLTSTRCTLTGFPIEVPESLEGACISQQAAVSEANLIL